MGVERRAERILWTAVVVVATGYIGVGLPYPVLGPLILAAHSHFVPLGLTPETAFGLVVALYPFGMFFGNQLFGRLSDTLGRKRALLISVSGSAIGYFASAYAIHVQSFALLLLSRVGTGFFEGNVPVGRAIAADLAPHIPKERSFGLISGAVYFGYIVGPLAGGFLGAARPAFPFIVAGILFLVLFCGVLSILPDNGSSATNSGDKPGPSWSLLQMAQIRQFFAASLLASLAISIFYQCFPILLVRRYDFGPVLIGWISFALTIALLISSIWVLRLVKRLASVRNTVIICSLLFAGLLTLVGLAHQTAALWSAFVAIGCCIPLVQTNIAIWSSDQLGPELQGRWMGLLGAGGALGATVVTLLGSIVAAVDPALPMLVGALLSLLAAIFVVLLSSRQEQHANVSPGT